jgi:tRNA(Ile)-lysidine synthetase-like protein
LTGGVRLRVDYDTVVVETEAAPTADPDYPLFAGEARIVVQLPGITPLGRWQLEAALSAIVNAQACLAIPATSVVELRTRQAGDRFAPFGLSGHTQKVNRWMINRKIPQAIRHRIPMLCVDAQIAAIIVGADWIIDEHYAVTDPAQRVVYFRFLQNP